VSLDALALRTRPPALIEIRRFRTIDAETGALLARGIQGLFDGEPSDDDVETVIHAAQQEISETGHWTSGKQRHPGLVCWEAWAYLEIGATS
jgi:hypothetical protein